MPVDHPMKFVPRIAEELDIDRETDRLSIDLLHRAKEEKILVGKDPRGMAAAALYLACKITDEQATQKDIAHATGTTEVTLRNRLKDLEKMENLD
jgi:transcription initiation factor TFIIB